MALVSGELKRTASEANRPITHILTASNKGAIALAERTDEYTFIGYDPKGNALYERIYDP